MATNVLKLAPSTPEKGEKHLQDFSTEEQAIIKLISEIIVDYVFRQVKKAA